MTDLTLDRLKLEEGYRGDPYPDSRGWMTIGYGCRLPLSEDEATAILRMRLATAVEELNQLAIYATLDPVRKSVLVDLCYNMGASKLLTFHKMIVALEQTDYDVAADELVNSDWFHQVGTRAAPLVEMLRTGKING